MSVCSPLLAHLWLIQHVGSIMQWLLLIIMVSSLRLAWCAHTIRLFMI